MASDPAGLNRFAEEYAAAWCSHDPDAVAAFFAENGSITVNDGVAAVGRAAIAEVARGFMRDFPDLLVTFDKLDVPAGRGHRLLEADGGRSSYDAIFHWTLIGHNTGPDGRGRAVRISGYESWKLGDAGLILESRGHFDAEDYARQINL